MSQNADQLLSRIPDAEEVRTLLVKAEQEVAFLRKLLRLVLSKRGKQGGAPSSQGSRGVIHG